MMFVRGDWSFYLMRVLLGVAEAGFFPGIILYLSYWFPARERARAVALFMMGSPIAGVIGNPVSGACSTSPEGLGGLAGWQWLFLIEGIPAVVLGVVTWFYLTDRPEERPVALGGRARVAPDADGPRGTRRGEAARPVPGPGDGRTRGSGC